MKVQPTLSEETGCALSVITLIIGITIIICSIVSCEKAVELKRVDTESQKATPPQMEGETHE